MADVFWTSSTSTVEPSGYPVGYLAVRVAGSSGAPDTFAQVAISDIIAFAVAQLATGQVPFVGLPDEANGDVLPAAGSGLPYLSGGVLKIA